VALLGGVILERLLYCFFTGNPEMDAGIKKKYLCQNEKVAW